MNNEYDFYPPSNQACNDKEPCPGCGKITTDYYGDLKVGQVWVPDDKNDYTMEIVKLTDDMVTIKEIETGCEFDEDRGGSDSFSDYLENCFYHLKK